jgi:hypothetical protein
MAADRDIELLDDYLANRMDAQSRTAFEQKLHSDPGLKTEFELQQKFIEGIRKARISELKSMMNSIPVPAAQTGGIAVGAKLAIATAIVAAVAVGIFLYTNKEENPVLEKNTVDQVEDTTTDQEATPGDENEPVNNDSSEDSPVVSEEESSLEQSPVESPKPVKKKKTPQVKPADPQIEVFDPSEEAKTSQPSEDLNDIGLPRPAATPALAVNVDAANKRYAFHYQFSNGELKLYGPFEKDLYEILEFFAADKRTVFLYYGDQYYQLSDADQRIKPLVTITDAALLKKLKESRSQ